MKALINKLLIIQKELKAPKSQRNTFGNYNYRSCEDILEAVKPLLNKERLVLCINDEVINIGGFNYIQSTATLYCEDEKIETKALAKEPLEQKGMSPSQITGASSSYARKYALNGLFAIDDGVDSDKTNKHGKEEIKKINWEFEFKNCKTLKELQEIYLKSPKTNELIILKDSLKLNLK